MRKHLSAGILLCRLQPARFTGFLSPISRTETAAPAALDLGLHGPSHHTPTRHVTRRRMSSGVSASDRYSLCASGVRQRTGERIAASCVAWGKGPGQGRQASQLAGLITLGRVFDGVFAQND